MERIPGHSMKWAPFVMGLMVGGHGMCTPLDDSENRPTQPQTEVVGLPEPRSSSDLSVERALFQRRSVRQFADEPLTLDELSQLLWAAQGITHVKGYRTAPSAGALYPLEVYVAVGRVEGVPEGVYRYQPQGHEMVRMVSGDQRKALAQAALHQACVEKGVAVIVFAAVYERTTGKYGDRGIRYTHIEVGHAAQNVYLQAEALHLGTVMVGAFSDTEVQAVLHLREDEQPLGIMPLGRK